MPAKSQAQARFMGAVAGGQIHPPGLSRDKAKEFLRGVDVKHLPKRVEKKPMQPIVKRVRDTIKRPLKPIEDVLTPQAPAAAKPRAKGDQATTYYDEQGRARKGVKPGTGGEPVGRRRRRERMQLIKDEAATKDKMARAAAAFSTSKKK